MTAELVTVAGHSVSVLSLSVLVTAIAVVALGLYPLLTEEPLQESLFFFLFCLAAAVWLFGFAVMYGAPSEGRALRWLRFAYLGVPLIPALAYTVAVQTLGIAEDRRMILSAIWSAAAVFSLLTVATDAIIDGLYRYPWGYYPRFTAAGATFLSYVIAGLGGTVAEYAVQYRRATEQRQLRWTGRYLLGFGLGSLAVVDFLPTYGVEIYPVGFGFVLALVAVIGHAIANYHLTEFTPAFAAERILATVTDPVVVCDEDRKIRVTNAAVTELLGYPENALNGAPVTTLLRPEMAEDQAWLEVLGRAPIQDEELTLETRSGDPVAASVSASAVTDASGRRVGTAVVFRDIRERKALEEQLRHQAVHDPLTGLPNRALYEDRLSQLLRLHERHGEPVPGVLYVDLDGFKAVNDQWGHEAGDRVLQEVADRLREEVRAGDTAARFGGDEFAVVLSDLSAGTAEREARQVAERIRDRLTDPMSVDGSQTELSVSVGIAVAEEAGQDPRQLTRRADLAMYRAKSSPTNRSVIFRPEFQREADRRLRLERDLEEAIPGDQLRLLYQPVLELGTDRLVALEALVRWRHPELGLLTPADFFPVAEETGQIVEIDRWVLRRACRQMARWRGDGGEVLSDARVLANVAEATIRTGKLVPLVQQALSDSGLPPEALELELTERIMVMEPSAVAKVTKRLRELGVRVSVDDFGTGASSLGLLRYLSLDGLKVDRSFVRRLARDEQQRTFVKAIHALAGELSLSVVAEGVEEREDAERLEEIGVPHAQGFLWAEPASADDLNEVLERLRLAPEARSEGEKSVE